MNRFVRWSLALAAAAALGPLSFAGPLTERISFDLEEGPVLGIFGSIAKILECEPRLDSSVASRKVSITLQRVRLSLALDTLCDSVGCQWRLEPAQEGRPCSLVVSNLDTGEKARGVADLETLLEQPITIQLKDASFAEVVRSFGSLLGSRLDLPAQLSGDGVTLDLKNTTVREVLDALLEPAGYQWRLSESSGERVLRVWNE